jgi:hypothetical protein
MRSYRRDEMKFLGIIRWVLARQVECSLKPCRFQGGEIGNCEEDRMGTASSHDRGRARNPMPGSHAADY